MLGKGKTGRGGGHHYRELLGEFWKVVNEAKSCGASGRGD